MMRDLAQAIHDLAMTGRLSDESAENIADILAPPDPVTDDQEKAEGEDPSTTRKTQPAPRGGK